MAIDHYIHTVLEGFYIIIFIYSSKKMERIQRVIGKTRPHVRGFLVFLSVLILIVTTYSVTNMKDVYVTGKQKKRDFASKLQKLMSLSNFSRRD